MSTSLEELTPRPQFISTALIARQLGTSAGTVARRLGKLNVHPDAEILRGSIMPPAMLFNATRLEELAELIKS
ncbi:MAG TPA: hypothetical protein PLX89_07700 [Verrucomicrobiota bacterium]|nr:hypothetical protein [Verrucomicrobiales bacterium]HRI12873.1 hypothetical protein [Verrucomicrobiota bacterium]